MSTHIVSELLRRGATPSMIRSDFRQFAKMSSVMKTRREDFHDGSAALLGQARNNCIGLYANAIVGCIPLQMFEKAIILQNEYRRVIYAKRADSKRNRRRKHKR